MSDAVRERALPWHMGLLELIDGATGRGFIVAAIVEAVDEQPFTVTVAE
jgi:hypothetical protein